MGERIDITITAEEILRVLQYLNGEIEETEEKAEEAIETVEKQTEISFNQVMGFMRASYSIISGMSRVMGGGMTQVFSSIYMAAMSAIGTYKAIAAAIAATGPTGWVQAAIMTTSLITASLSLVSIMTGQRVLSTKIRGINMALHGISGIISSFSL